MKCKFSKTLIALTAALFIGSISSASAAPHNVYKLNVPEDIGQVKERYQGTSEKVIVHIQDAHTSFEAQKNLCSIIETLVSDEGIQRVAVEGAEGLADLKQIREIPNVSTKRDAVESLVKQGIITGSEAAHIVSDKYFNLIGAEDMDLYDLNYDAFVSTLSRREEILDQIEAVENILNDLRTPLYSENVAAFDAAVQSYRSGDISFFDYCGKLLQYGIKGGVDISQYVSFTMLLEAKSWEDQIEFDKVEAETNAVIRAIQSEFAYREDALSKKKFEIFSKLLSSFKGAENKKGASNTDFYTLAKNLAQEIGVDQEEFKNFYNFATYLSLFARLDKGGLLAECKLLQRDIEEGLASGEELELVHLIRNVHMMKDIAELKVLPEDVNYYRENREKFASEVFAAFLESQGVLGSFKADLAKLDEILPSVEDFYEFAEKRSEVMSDKVIASMDAYNDSVMPFVAGGYHTEGITEYLKSKGISYLVITPKLETATEDVPYLDRMLNKPTNFELMINSAYNTIVKYLISEAKQRGIVLEPLGIDPIKAASIEVVRDAEDKLRAFYIAQGEGDDASRIEIALGEMPSNLLHAMAQKLLSSNINKAVVSYYGGMGAGDDEGTVQEVVYTYTSGEEVSELSLISRDGKVKRFSVEDAKEIKAKVQGDVVLADSDVFQENIEQAVLSAVDNKKDGITFQEAFQILFPESTASSAFALNSATVPAAAKKAMEDIVAKYAEQSLDATSAARSSRRSNLIIGQTAAFDDAYMASDDFNADDALKLAQAQVYITVLKVAADSSSPAMLNTINAVANTLAVPAGVEPGTSFAQQIENAVKNAEGLLAFVTDLNTISYEESFAKLPEDIKAVLSELETAELQQEITDVVKNGVSQAAVIALVDQIITDLSNVANNYENHTAVSESLKVFIASMKKALTDADVEKAAKVAMAAFTAVSNPDNANDLAKALDLPEISSAVDNLGQARSVADASIRQSAASYSASTVPTTVSTEYGAEGQLVARVKYGESTVAMVTMPDVDEGSFTAELNNAFSEIDNDLKVSLVKAQAVAAEIKTQVEGLRKDPAFGGTPADATYTALVDAYTADIDSTDIAGSLNSEVSRIQTAMQVIDAIAADYGNEYSLKLLPPAALAEQKNADIKDEVTNDSYDLQDIVAFPDHDNNTVYVNAEVVRAAVDKEIKEDPKSVNIVSQVVKHDAWEMKNPPQTKDGVVTEAMDVYEERAHKQSPVEEAVPTLKPLVDSADEDGRVDVNQAKGITTIIEKTIDDIEPSRFSRSREAYDKKLQDTMPSVAASLVITLDEEMLSKDRLLNEEGFVQELRGILDNYPVLGNVFIVVDVEGGFDGLDEARQAVLTTAIADRIGAKIVDTNSEVLLSDYNNKSLTKVIIGRGASLLNAKNQALAGDGAAVHAVDIKVPEEQQGNLMTDALPFSFAMGYSLELVNKNTSAFDKLGILQKDPQTGVFFFPEEALQSLNMADLLGSLKTVLRGMNDELRRVRAEKRSLWTAA